MKENQIEVLIEKYNQKGEGVGFINNKPIYIFGTIVGEKVLVKIIENKNNYLIGRVEKILTSSKNRIHHNIERAWKIGGYELIHMNDEEQIRFKKTRIINDFLQIAKFKITHDQIEIFWGQKRFKYRNKITLHDGYFYEKQTNKKIKLNDYLLSDIKYDSGLKGEVIYRQLDSLIYGKKGEQKYTTDSMFGYTFRVGLNSFYQINKEVTLVMYQDLLDWIIEGGTTLDLYAGIATITIIASSKSRLIHGVEINKNSYDDAIFNISKNKVKNINFVNDDAIKFLKNWNKKEVIDTLILDPSRSGIKQKDMELIIDLKPKRIIYLACNPGNQIANFNLLKQHYKLTKVKIYDMFCQTYHIEMLMILDLKK